MSVRGEFCRGWRFQIDGKVAGVCFCNGFAMCHVPATYGAGRNNGTQIWAWGRRRSVEEANGLLPEGIILDVSEREAGRPGHGCAETGTGAIEAQ
jgi:hypothetical protein